MSENNIPLKIRHSLFLIAPVLLLAACATARMEAQWSDAALAGQPVAGSKVFVACDAAEQTVKRICQDKLSAQLGNLGATTVQAGSEGGGSDRYLAAARASGAKTVVVATLSQSTVLSTGRGPGVGFGIGGGSGGFGTGVGISFPIGGTSTDSTTTYASDTAITSVASGKLAWSGKASTIESDVSAQIDALVKVTIEAARKAGVL